MNKQNDQDQEQDLRKRIVSRIEAARQAQKRPLTAQELESLRSAASRLDQLLDAANQARLQSLKTAAAKLDQLLADLGAGKDVASVFKRRASRQNDKE